MKSNDAKFNLKSTVQPFEDKCHRYNVVVTEAYEKNMGSSFHVEKLSKQNNAT